MKKSKFVYQTLRTYGELVVVVAIALVATGVFVLSRGEAPHTSELAYIEHSALGERAGSVVPASCDATSIAMGGTPGSHFSGDCLTACPTPYDTYFYDPYFDPGMTACPKPSKVTVSFGTPGVISAVSILSFASDMTYVAAGDVATISWSVAGATSCSITGTGITNPVASIPTGTRTAWYGGSLVFVNRTFTLTCTDGILSAARQITVRFEGSGSSCFVPGTKVSMADGSQRDIEQIIVGDAIKTGTGVNTVSRVLPRYYRGQIYAFNGGDHFVTPNHPFMTSEGWKAIDPDAARKENPTLEVGKLKIGDVLIKEGGSTEKLEALSAKHYEGMVYNFEIKDVHEYYADGYLVHNKIAP